MNSKINVPFNVIQGVNTSLRISREISRSHDPDQYSLYSGWYTQVNDRFQEHKTS